MFTHFTALETNEQVELNKKILVLHSQQLTIEFALWESLQFAFTFLAYLSQVTSGELFSSKFVNRRCCFRKYLSHFGFFLRTTSNGLISPKLDTYHPWV